MRRPILYILSVFSLVVISIIGSGCSFFCDGSVGEPTFSLTISESLNVSKIYALVDNELGKQIGDNNPFYNELPVDMNSQSVVYVFEQSGQADTLEILYEIKTEVESRVCGLRVRTDNVELGARTTFTDVVIDDSYSYTEITVN